MGKPGLADPIRDRSDSLPEKPGGPQPRRKESLTAYPSVRSQSATPTLPLLPWAPNLVGSGAVRGSNTDVVDQVATELLGNGR